MSAYSKSLAWESLNDHFLVEKYDEKTGTHSFVTRDDFERYARIVAYKVAKNLKLGMEMDPRLDPLTYVDCDDYPPL